MIAARDETARTRLSSSTEAAASGREESLPNRAWMNLRREGAWSP